LCHSDLKIVGYVRGHSDSFWGFYVLNDLNVMEKPVCKKKNLNGQQPKGNRASALSKVAKFLYFGQKFLESFLEILEVLCSKINLLCRNFRWLKSCVA